MKALSKLSTINHMISPSWSSINSGRLIFIVSLSFFQSLLFLDSLKIRIIADDVYQISNEILRRMTPLYYDFIYSRLNFFFFLDDTTRVTRKVHIIIIIIKHHMRTQ